MPELETPEAPPAVEAPPVPPPAREPAPPAAPTPSSDFKSLAERLTGMIPTPPTTEEVNAARIKAAEKRELQTKGAFDFATTQAVEYDALKKEGQSFAEEAKRRAEAVRSPHLSTPPSRGLHQFLQPIDGEPPEKSIGKLMQSISLFATMIGGGRAGARASLSAMTGALEGWKAGDRERADRAFSDWKAQTETMLKRWEAEFKSYESWFKAAGLPIEQRREGLRLEAMKRGNFALAEKLAVDDTQTWFKELEERQKFAIEMNRDLLRTVSSKELGDDKLHQTRELQDRAYALRERIADENIKKSHTPQMSDEQLASLAVMEFNGGRVPSFGMGQSADRTRYNIVKSEVAEKLGGPAAVAARQSALAGLKRTQGEVMKVQGLVEAFSETAAKNLRDAEKLSNAVDRTDSPMLNKWLLNGRKAWAGDADVVDFDVAARTAINETARVLNSANASGVISDTARQEIESMLNTALTKEQFTRAVKRLLQEMQNRRTSYEDQLVAIDKAIKRAASVPGQATDAPAAAGNDPLGIRR